MRSALVTEERAPIEELVLSDQEKRAIRAFILALRIANTGRLEVRRLPDGSYDFYHVRQQRVGSSQRP